MNPFFFIHHSFSTEQRSKKLEHFDEFLEESFCFWSIFTFLQHFYRIKHVQFYQENYQKKTKPFLKVLIQSMVTRASTHFSVAHRTSICVELQLIFVYMHKRWFASIQFKWSYPSSKVSIKLNWSFYTRLQWSHFSNICNDFLFRRNNNTLNHKVTSECSVFQTFVFRGTLKICEIFRGTCAAVHSLETLAKRLIDLIKTI